MKVICTIPARLNSKRLPNKLMLDIAGKPVLVHTIEQVRKAKRIDECWIVTAQNECNKEIWTWAQRLNIGIYAGDEVDIISRILIVANDRKADIIVNVDGEQPEMDPWVIDQSVAWIEHGFPSFSQTCIPLGKRCHAFTRDALKTIYSKYETNTDLNWGSLFDGEFGVGGCVDTEADFQTIKERMESGTH